MGDQPLNVVILAGRPYAAGMYWLERRKWFGLVQMARRLGRPYYVHFGGQTGYAKAEPESPDGLPALAVVLAAHIEDATWMALAEGEEGGFALVRMRDSSFLADHDEIHDNREGAVEAFEAVRDSDWKLYATAGLVSGSVTELDAGALVADDTMLLRRAPLAGLQALLRRLGIVLLVAALAVGWWQRESLRERVFGAERVEAVAAAEIPLVWVSVDSGALIDGCRRAMARFPPYMPAWEIDFMSCAARFQDDVALALKPELTDRAVLMVRWKLPAEHGEALHRQVAEQHLAHWYMAVVAGRQAWAVVPLRPVLQLAPTSAPEFVALRRMIDRRLGPQATEIKYRNIQAGGGTVTIRTGHSLRRVWELMAGIKGLEVVKLSRTATVYWEIEGRRVKPAEILEPRFEALRREVDDGRWS